MHLKINRALDSIFTNILYYNKRDYIKKHFKYPSNHRISIIKIIVPLIASKITCILELSIIDLFIRRVFVVNFKSRFVVI